jgi:hypothetical protein
MKKLFFIAAIASAALVSCTKNEVAQTATQQEITFASPVVGAATKAIPGELSGANYPTGELFNVYAVWHKEDFAGWTGANTSLYMDDVQTKYDDTFNGWRPIDRHYWPKNGKMTFAAYSPSDINATSHSYGAAGLSLTGFQVEASAANHVDVLYSKRSYNKQKGSANENTPYDEVDIDFMHALSSIQFTAKTAANYGTTVIKLKNISLFGVNSKGNFAETIDEATPGTYKATPTWSLQSVPVDEANAYVYYDYSSGQTLSDAAWVMNGQANQTDLICLPQTLPATATIKVKYSINPPGDTTPEVDITLPVTITGSWEPGKRYTYHLTLALDEIYFAPEVTNWTEEVSVVVPQI